MRSKAGFRALLVVGFLAAWIGYDAWIATHTVLDPGATRNAARALIAVPAVQHGLADQITAQIDRQLPTASRDPRIAPAVAAALRDPRVANAFANTIAQVHRAVLSDGDGREFTVDGRSVSLAVHDALAPSDPRAAAQIDRLPPLALDVRAGDLPHVTDPRPAAAGITLLGIAAALLLITAALLSDPTRHTTALVGRRIAYLAVTPLVLFAIVPRALEHLPGEVPDVTAVLLRAYGGRVLVSAFALAIAGVALVVGAHAWPRPVAVPPPASRPTPPSNPPASPDQPAITEKLYL